MQCRFLSVMFLSDLAVLTFLFFCVIDTAYAITLNSIAEDNQSGTTTSAFTEYETNTAPSRDGFKHQHPGFTSGSRDIETLSWAVKLDFDPDVFISGDRDHFAGLVAADLDLDSKGQVGHLQDVYLFAHQLHESTVEAFRFVNDEVFHNGDLTHRDGSAHPPSGTRRGSTRGQSSQRRGAQNSHDADVPFSSPRDVIYDASARVQTRSRSHRKLWRRSNRRQVADSGHSDDVIKLDDDVILNAAGALPQSNHIPSSESDHRRLKRDLGKGAINDRRLDNLHHMTWQELSRDIQAKLDAHASVVWHTQQRIRRRRRRDLVDLKLNDPMFSQQWHLINRVTEGMDINVTGVWAQNVTGRGVTAVVVDDGLEWTNPDLRPNYNPDGSWDLNSNDADPTPDASKSKNHHGTRCAGEIVAAAGNAFCGVGVAPGARIAGIRVLDGPMTDSLEATAFTKNFDVNDVYSCSWGPDDDGKTVDGPHHLANTALRHGVDYGRHGYGSIYVVASGNGGMHSDNCNYDGYANSIYTITIGAVDEFGEMPYYAEECASMLAVTFSSGSQRVRSIVTTDWSHYADTGCTSSHTGTSAAAPLAAGMVALILEAQPCLTWRDVQHIIVMTAVKVDIDLAHWHTNAAGLHHSHKHGFGLMNAWNMVNAAKVWDPVPWMTVYTCEDSVENRPIPTRNIKLTLQKNITMETLLGYNLYTLEYVQVTLTMSHSRRGDLEIRLDCPSGTSSVLGAMRGEDDSTEGFQGWTFSTVRCWGEEAQGTWTLTVTDKGKGATVSRGILVTWQLKLFGSPMTFEEVQDRLKTLKDSYSGRYLNASSSPVCYPPPVKTRLVAPMSERILKILVLSAGFCAFMAFYETFEYAFCYNDEKKEHEEMLALQRRANRVAAAQDCPPAATPARAGPSRTPARHPGDGRSDERARLLGDDDDIDAEMIPLDDLSANGAAASAGSANQSSFCLSGAVDGGAAVASAPAVMTQWGDRDVSRGGHVNGAFRDDLWASADESPLTPAADPAGYSIHNHASMDRAELGGGDAGLYDVTMGGVTDHNDVAAMDTNISMVGLSAAGESVGGVGHAIVIPPPWVSPDASQTIPKLCPERAAR